MSHKRRSTALPKSITRPRMSRRRALFILIIFAAVSAVIWDRTAHRPQTGGDWARYHDKTFRVVRVIDGDTLDIDIADGTKPHTRIRLWGVDTPETGHGSQPEMHFGAESTAFARSTLLDRDVNVVLLQRRTRGKYGRLLAYVFLDRGGIMFNEMLIEQGYAYADRRFPHHYDKSFTATEKRVRRESVGLWAEITTDKMPPWRQRFEDR